jgi:protein SCO1/2
VPLFAFSLGFGFALPFLNDPWGEGEFYGRRVSLEAPDFRLTDLEGTPRGLADFKCRYTFLMFGYLGCDGLCQNQLLVLHQLRLALGPHTARFVFVAMDPERDTPETLRAFFAGGYQGITVLTGEDIRAVQEVALAYNAAFSRGPEDAAGNYTIDHPGFVYLLDPRGRVRLVYAGRAIRPEAVQGDLKRLQHHST